MTRTERVRQYRGANAKIARSGYPEATSTDSARGSQALGLFISNAVAFLDTQSDSVTQRRSRPLLRRHSSSGK
jgi:hypothetical protein